MLFQVFLSSPSGTLTLLAELGIQVSCSQYKLQFTLVSWGRWGAGPISPDNGLILSATPCVMPGEPLSDQAVREGVRF